MAKALLTWRRYRGKQVCPSYNQGSDRYYKEWRTTCKRYRIVWRNRFDDIPVDPGYYPCIRGNPDTMLIWDKLSAKQYKLNRTLGAAQKLCEEHFKTNFPREAAAELGMCFKSRCRRQAIEGTEFCEMHTKKKPAKPAKEAKPSRKKPMKTCPECSATWGSRKATCSCGHVFYTLKEK